jgi:hypothetical protein
MAGWLNAQENGTAEKIAAERNFLARMYLPAW